MTSDTSSTTDILRRYKTLVLQDANEAATRLKVIDRILREVLQWLDDDISPEEHVSEDGATTYADYILRTANTAIVVEAKKATASFTVEPGPRRVKLTNAFMQSELGNAIQQARDYARKCSIDFAVATNGSTWAIFPAQRHDQVKFNDSTALVFWTLEDALKENYQEFFDLLSRDAVIGGSLENGLLGRAENQVENRKLGSFFSTSTRGPATNPIFPVIQDEVMAAFSDSIVGLSDENFEKCYVTSTESMKFDSKIRMHIGRRQAVVGGDVLRPMRDREATQIVDRFRTSALNRKPLATLLLGTVGSGKTTFLHYIRRVRLRDVFKQDTGRTYPHWMHLDFLPHDPSKSASDFIYSALRDYISNDGYLGNYEKCTRQAYSSEINALKSGPLFHLANATAKFEEKISELVFSDYQNVRPYVDKILRYATQNAAFFLAIDNVDQIEDESIQSRLFSEALAIGRNLSINLILCLRQATFVKHRNSPSIDAFDFEAIQIDPPRIASVLSKRFTLVKLLTEGKKGDFTAENGFKVRVEDASQLIDLLQGSVLGTEIGARIEVLATEDVRLALRMTREFLERGYSNPGRAIEFYRRTGRYILPKHEAFRAILLGTRPIYSEDFSPLGNPFDSRLAVAQAQLLRLYVLSAVVAYASEASFRFCDGFLIADNLKKIGFGDTYTRRVLFDLCKYRFLFTANHSDPGVSSSFISSRLGGYVVKDLVSNFTFVENVMFDTYISDGSTWSTLRALSHRIESERDTFSRVSLRVQRAKVFFKYMEFSYLPLVIEAQRRGLPSQWCGDVLKERRGDFRKDLLRVLSSARRNYRRGGQERNASDQKIYTEADFAELDDLTGVE